MEPVSLFLSTELHISQQSNAARQTEVVMMPAGAARVAAADDFVPRCCYSSRTTHLTTLSCNQAKPACGSAHAEYPNIAACILLNGCVAMPSGCDTDPIRQTVSDTHRTCRAVMFDHSLGSDPCKALPVAFTPLRESMPLAHCGGSTPSILLPPMFLQQQMAE
jgi:hypothetical protein